MAPKGQSTRPTADRTREAIFNVLEHASWSPGPNSARVIDLFAGSGALGLEALSRGAASCRFIDHDAAARHAIAENAVSLGVEALTQIDGCDAREADRTSGEFDLAFLDPPYGEHLALASLAALRDRLTEDALAVVEVGAREHFSAPSGYEALDERTWGAAKVVFLTRF